MFDDSFIGNVLPNLPVKEIWKSSTAWQRRSLL